MDKNKIYVPLQGRIGNQLFQYALARKIQLDMGEDARIVMDDSDILRCKWENSLVHYNLPNVEYVHDNIIKSEGFASKAFLLRKIYRFFTRNKPYMQKYKAEKMLLPFFNRFGMFFCENGYLEPKLNVDVPVYLEGYFQSEKYFESVREDILKILDGSQFPQLEHYAGIEQLRNRNSVCISVKVEHNVGSSMYSVCTMDYWKNAIQYIIDHVENPLFFICSDNVDYVLENLIDAGQFDYLAQSKDQPVHISLAAMAQCKHFIIGNTTFGWWAQYLSSNPEKMVVAPSKWMATEMPIDIYQDFWHLIEVE